LWIQVIGVLGHARPDPHQRAESMIGAKHHPVDRDLLDLVKERLAPARVALARLLLNRSSISG